MGNCVKCGSSLEGGSGGWKCRGCGKMFRVSMKELHDVRRRKEKAGRPSLLKCPSCGAWLDDGKEEIYIKCPSCGNAAKGNLAYFVGTRKTENAIAPKAKNDAKVPDPPRAFDFFKGLLAFSPCILLGFAIMLLDKGWASMVGFLFFLSSGSFLGYNLYKDAEKSYESTLDGSRGHE